MSTQAPVPPHSQMTLSEQLCHTTVRISCELIDGTPSTGTGFFFNFLRGETTHVPAIVTNKHVVANSAVGTFTLTRRLPSGLPAIGQLVTVTLDGFAGRWINHPSPDVDLCILPIAFLSQEFERRVDA